MEWPYEFASLSAEQIQSRRKLLDLYGFYAYLSPIFLLSLIYIIRNFQSIFLSQNASSKSQEPHQKSSPFQLQLRRLSWWLSDPITPEFGERKVHLLGLFYLSWLLFLSVHRTGNDYLHLTKRLGHVAISQLPLQYTFAIKSPRSPVTFATGLSWETLNPYHRLFGRIVHLLVAAHAILYMNFFIAANILQKRILNTDVQLGLAAFWTFNALAILSIPPLRKFAYHKAFYRPHVGLSLLLLPLLALHVPYTRKYILQAFIAYMFNGMLRAGYTTDPPILSSVMPIEGTNLFKFCAPGPAWGVPPLMGKGSPGWIPGQHVYLKRSMSPKEMRNPFTVASLPPRDGQEGGFEQQYIDLVIRNVAEKGMTGWLAGRPKEDGHKDRNVKVLIEGPYGLAKHFVQHLQQEARQRYTRGTVLFVAGGVGATYTFPIYLSLLEAIHKGEKKSFRDSTSEDKQDKRPLNSQLKLKFILIVKSAAETKWAVDMMRRNIPALLTSSDTHGFLSIKVDIDAQIYITRRSSATTTTTTTNAQKPIESEDLSSHARPMDIHPPSASEIEGLQIHAARKRPQLNDLIAPIFETTEKASGHNDEPVTVLSCGPQGLTKELRAEVGKYVYRDGRDVRWHEEQFGHGGS